MLEEGDKAPAVEVTTSAGNDIRLDAPGAPLVVYFYPKDMTPGCTTEAIDFSEHLAAFEAEGARVIGVSRDSMERHEKFIGKHDLTVPLVSDEDGKVSDGFGTWGEKQMYGKKFMGMHRATFLLDRNGTIVKAWPKVRVKGHVEAVLEAVKAL